MKLDETQVRHLAKVAQLELTDTEIQQYAEDLSAILDYFDMLQSVDTAKVAPTAHVSGLANITRPDEVHATNKETRVQILDNAPNVKNDYIKTKGVFE